MSLRKVKAHKTWFVTIVAALLMGVLAGGAFAKTEIVVMGHWSAQQAENIVPYFEEYERLNPDISIRFEPVTFNEYLTKILVGAVSGVRPDVYHIYNAWLPQLVENGVVGAPPRAIEEHIRANFTPASVDGTSYDGQLWGYPTEVNTYALVYNKRLLAEAGYDRPPQTWDELREYAAKLTKRDDSGTVIQAGFASWVGDVSGVVHPFYSFLFANGGEILNADRTKAAFNSPEGLEALELYAEIVSTPALTSYEDLGSGRVAMGIFAPWGKLYFKNQMGDSFNDLATAPIPRGKVGHGTVTYGWSYVVDSSSKNAQAAWEFVKWLNTATGDPPTSRMGHYLAAVLGAIPSGEADIANHPDQLGDAFTRTYVESLAFGQSAPLVIPAAEINNALQTEIESVFAGAKTPAQALDAAERRVNDILSDY